MVASNLRDPWLRSPSYGPTCKEWVTPTNPVLVLPYSKREGVHLLPVYVSISFDFFFPKRKRIGGLPRCEGGVRLSLDTICSLFSHLGDQWEVYPLVLLILMFGH